MASASSASVPSTAGTIRTTPDGGREIVIKLDPEHLGQVAIRLRLTGGAVDVNITVSNPGTLGTLDRDRHMLTAALASAGLSGDTLTLATGSTAPAGGSSTATETGGQSASGQPQNGSAAASGDPSGAGGRRRDGGASSSDASDALPAPTESAGAAPDRAGALYV